MRKFLLFLTLFISKIAFAQVSDNFNDGDFTQNPVWLGDVSGYTVNTAKQLQTTSNTAAQTVNLYTINSLATNVKWDFFIDMLFDPSSSNQMRIYLISDQANLNGSLNGYFLQIGESGSNDSYDLYRQNGTTVTRIIDGPAKKRINVNECKAKIQVTRDFNGFWELKTDITGGTTYTSEGTVSDDTFTSTAYFGIKSIYTSTRSNLFYYDDFLITELVPDVTPPVLNSANTSDGLAIVLNFNEAVDPADAAILNHYQISPGNIQPSIVTVSGNEVTLNMATQLSTGNYTATVNTIKDIKGNTSVTPQSKTFFYKKPYLAKLNDIVINEISQILVRK
nr:Ig-like domain-containing protein [Pseudopedobacter sp.]